MCDINSVKLVPKNVDLESCVLFTIKQMSDPSIFKLDLSLSLTLPNKILERD